MQNQPPNQQGYNIPYNSSQQSPDAPNTTAPSSSPGDKTGMGLDANIAALLAYVLTWVTGLVFFLIEKENRLVRFHAMQAILLGAAWTIVIIMFSIIGMTLSMMHLGLLNILFIPVRLLFWLGFLGSWIFCMIKAFKGEWFKLPIIGEMAAKIANK